MNAVIDQPLLFEVPETLSPRLAWMRKHDVHTEHCGALNPVGFSPWLAWVGQEPPVCEDDITVSWAQGDTEDDALAALAREMGVPLWNEEGFLKEKGGRA